MTPEAIGRLAHRSQREGATPESIILRELSSLGITGDFGDPAFRKAYLECEREWLRLFRASDGPQRCGNCGKPTSKQGARLCRECWLNRREWSDAPRKPRPDRNAEMVRLRELGLTYQEIADRFGLSEQRVIHIIRRAA